MLFPINKKHFDITVNNETAKPIRILLNAMDANFEEVELFGATTFMVHETFNGYRRKIQHAVTELFETIGTGSMKMDAFPHK